MIVFKLLRVCYFSNSTHLSKKEHSNGIINIPIQLNVISMTEGDYNFNLKFKSYISVISSKLWL